MSEAPPSYSEHGEDLVAELAKMKAMMEQMRMEKERMETEAKCKAEEEAVREATRKEEEAAEKEANEIKALYAELHADFMKEWYEKGLSALVRVVLEQRGNGGFDAYYTIDENTRRPIVKRNNGLTPEGIQLAENYIQDGLKKLPIVTSFIKENILLGCKYVHHWISSQSLYITPKGLFTYNLTTNLWCPMYLFNKQLCAKDIHILRQIEGMIQGIIFHGGWKQGYPMSLSNLEAVIRLIPGSYKNGDWKQLNGIFGMYFNETTMEVTQIPPPSL